MARKSSLSPPPQLGIPEDSLLTRCRLLILINPRSRLLPLHLRLRIKSERRNLCDGRLA